MESCSTFCSPNKRGWGKGWKWRDRNTDFKMKQEAIKQRCKPWAVVADHRCFKHKAHKIVNKPSLTHCWHSRTEGSQWQKYCHNLLCRSGRFICTLLLHQKCKTNYLIFFLFPSIRRFLVLLIPPCPIEVINYLLPLKSFLFLHIEDMCQSVNFVSSRVYHSPDCKLINMPAPPGVLQRCVPVSFNIRLLQLRLVFLSSSIKRANISVLAEGAFWEVLDWLQSY